MDSKTAGMVVVGLLSVFAGYVATRTVQQWDSNWTIASTQDAGIASPIAPSAKSSLVDARLAIFERVDQLPDAPAIEREFRRLARSTPSLTRDAELEALLLRFVDMDPLRAIQIVMVEGIDSEFIAMSFQAWASTDPEAALTALAEVQDESLRRNIAITLVGVLLGPEAIERLADVGGQGNPKGFLIDTLERLATYDPESAIGQAASLSDYSLQTVAFQRIAREWADLNVSAALNYVPLIRDSALRNVFHVAVLDQWVSSDPDGALEYIGSLEGRRLLSILPQEMVATLASKLRIDRPEGMLEVADRLDDASSSVFRQFAESALIERDLPDALARFEAMPVNSESRARLLAGIASAYARQDPEAALEWAGRLDEASAAAAIQRIVQEGIGRTDPMRAFDLALANDVPFNPSPPTLLSDLSADEFMALADKLVVNGEPLQQAVYLLMQAWPRRDPSGQWAWLLRQGASADPVLISRAAAGFGNIGIELPAQSIYELPEGLRQEWVVSFVDEYARQDPDAAVDWLANLRSDPAYDDWSSDAARLLLAMSPARPAKGDYVHIRAVSEILASMSDPPPNLVGTTAASWARTDPTEATQWAFRLPESEARTSAILAGIGGWTATDPAAAERWTLTLPAGDVRDRALIAQLAQEIGSHGSVSERIVDAIGSRDELQAAIAGHRTKFIDVFRALGSRDADTAMELVERYIEDPGLKSDIEAAIEEIVGAGRTIPGNTVFRVNY